MNVSGVDVKDRLLLALAEQLKLPLLQIARKAELDRQSEITDTADIALKLIDSYILSIAPDQTALALEPVSLAAVMQEAAHQLSNVARQYDCELEIHISGKYGPVMANRQNLLAAYTMLGYSFIEAGSSQDNKNQLLLAVHKSAKGIVAGIFSQQQGLSGDMFRRAKALYGTARQPITSMSTTSGASLFVADSLIQSMASTLRPAQHHKLTGLAATLLPSQQMRLNVG